MYYSHDIIKNKVYDTVKKSQTLYPQAQVLVAMTGDSIENRSRFTQVIEAYKDGTKQAGGTYITNS
jgi:hypothetical protein